MRKEAEMRDRFSLGLIIFCVGLVIIAIASRLCHTA